jgi:predicted nucleotidyltransferase
VTNIPLLQEIKSCLAAVYGQRLQGVVLYGSEARGDAAPDSDIDILVLLEGPARTWADIKNAVEAVYPIILRTGRIIDVRPVDARRYRQSDAPLYEAARREGILL